MGDTTTPALCLEICGQKDGKPRFCSRLEGHGGDHDPDAVERAERAADAMGEPLAARETGDGMIEVKVDCESCGTKVVLEVQDNRMGRKWAETITNGGVQCEACADIAERASGEMTQQQAVENRRASSGMPPKWARQTFDELERDDERERAIDLAQLWGGEDIPGLVLWGDVGRGKTAIAAAAAVKMLEVRRVRWVAVAELMMALRGGFDSPDYQRALRKLDAGRGGAGIAALILEDLDKLKPTEHQVMPIYTAINAWIEAGGPLLVTLNRDLDELREWLPETFAEPICSRLAGYCKVRQVRGRDRRIEP